MKKVMFFRPLIYFGGTEVATLSLIKKIYKDYEIIVCYTDENSDKNILNEFKKYVKLVRLNEIDSIDVDILITTSSHYQKVINEINKIHRKKTILWLHYFLTLSTSILEDEEVNNIDNIVVVSDTNLGKIKKLYSNISDKFISINNVIDSDEIINKSKENYELDLSKKLNLVTVARVCKEKGFDRVYHLASVLRDRGIDFKWYMIGENIDINVYNEFKNKFIDFKDNIIWLGKLNNPYKIVKQCDYLVLLSDDETWGLVVTEAMILGVPCICSDFDAVYEQIEDKKNGIILSREDLDSYKDRIEDIISNKEKYKNAVSNYEYNNDLIIKKWRNIIEEV